MRQRLASDSHHRPSNCPTAYKSPRSNRSSTVQSWNVRRKSFHILTLAGGGGRRSGVGFLWTRATRIQKRRKPLPMRGGRRERENKNRKKCKSLRMSDLSHNGRSGTRDLRSPPPEIIELSSGMIYKNDKIVPFKSPTPSLSLSLNDLGYTWYIIVFDHHSLSGLVPG